MRDADSCKALLSDTDSICYSVSFAKENNDPGTFWRKLGELAPLMDTRDYPSDHPYFKHANNLQFVQNWQRENYKKIGLMRDESGGEHLIASVCSLKAKCYNIRFFNRTSGEYCEKIRAKGIAKKTAQKVFNSEAYADCLISGTSKFVTFKSMKHQKHNVYISSLTKRGLAAYNTKVFQINLCNTIPFGHYDIPYYQRQYNDEAILQQLVEIAEENECPNDTLPVCGKPSVNRKVSAVLENFM